MTEQEIIDDALKAVPDYLASIRATGEFDLDTCVEYELRRVNTLFKAQRKLKGWSPLNKRDRQERDLVLAHFIPMLKEATIPIRDRYLKGRRIQAINATTARAVITSALETAGFKAAVVGQRYRARVEVDVTDKSSLSFYVRYKDVMNGEVMAAVIKSVLQIRDAVSQLGYGVLIKRK